VRRYRPLTLCFFLLFAGGLPAQEHGSFDLLLDVDLNSARAAVGLYQGLAGRPADLARMRGSRIALATTATISGRALTLEMLERSLEAAKFNQDPGEDLFGLLPARRQVAAIRELLDELERRNFSRRVVGTVEQLFPSDARLTGRVPVFVVAFGPQTVDAFVRRVVWRGDHPVYTGEGEGELTIVVNLARAVSYGSSTDERFLSLVSVVAHEVFHAAFGMYKDRSAFWRRFYDSPLRPFDHLLDLAHNEGIAYYLSLVQQSRGMLSQEGESHARAAFVQFSSAAEELLSPTMTAPRAEEILRRSNTSGHWESFGAITGMIVARQIDRTYGRTALVETISAGPYDFFAKYAELQKRDVSLPQLSSTVLREILRAGAR
jgi:hypothetical protein